MTKDKIERLHDYGREVLGKIGYGEWLASSNPFLEGQRPIDILDTDSGIKAIEDMLTRIDHGIF
nr:MbcA/ParS/Xre antitoxin family protein [Allomuricauda sp.]